MMASGMVVTSFLCLIINTYYSGKLIRVGYFVQMKDIMPTMIICLLMSALMLIISKIIPNIYCQFLMSGLLGVLFYVGAARLFLKEQYDYVLSLVKNKKSN